MTISSGPVAKYHQLAQILRRQIQSGELPAHTQAPTEESLCRQYGLSRGTVRQALHALAQEGLLRREQGRGTFINPPPAPLTSFTLTSFDRQMQQQGRVPETRVLAQQVIAAPQAAAERLSLTVGAPVIVIERLRLADGRPIVHETRMLAQELCPDLLAEDLESQSVSDLLIRTYGLPLLRLTHTIELRPLTPPEADLLDAAAGLSAFHVDRLTVTRTPAGERPAVWYRAICRGDEYAFRAEFLSAY